MVDRTALFDRWAADYDESLTKAAGFPFEGYRQVLRRVFELAVPQPGLKVLDVGTGTGALVALFAQAGCRVTGVDFSEEMLQRARAGVPGGTFLQLDILADWPEVLRCQAFDVVVSSYVMHEFDDRTKVEVLGRLARETVTVGGHLLVGDIMFPDEAAREDARQEWDRHWDTDEHYAAADLLVAALESEGFEARFEPISFWAGVIDVCRQP